MDNRSGGVRRRSPGENTMQYGAADAGRLGGRGFGPQFAARGQWRASPGRGPFGPPPPGRYHGRGSAEPFYGRGRGPPTQMQTGRGRGPSVHRPPNMIMPGRGFGRGPGRGMPGHAFGPPLGRPPIDGRGPERFPGRGHGPGHRPPPPPPPPPPHRAGNIIMGQGMQGRSPYPPIAGRGGVYPMQPNGNINAPHLHTDHFVRPPQRMPPSVVHNFPPGMPPGPQGHVAPPFSQAPAMRPHVATTQNHAPASSTAPGVQPSAASTALVPESSYTQAQIDEAWTEHTAPNSHKYYYNAITKESTYSKPDHLKKKEETAAQAVVAAPAVSSWTEYTDPSSGKKYYSDGTTTTWEKPENFTTATAELDSNAESEEQIAPPKKKARQSRPETKFSNKEEAIAAFKGLLLAKDISPTAKWTEVSKQCSSDSRWEACSILSVGERKQALAEYQTKRANELKTKEREERMRAKEAFMDLLSEKLPALEGFSPLTSRFSDMREALSKSDRFYAVDDENTRESLFLEFCEEVQKREERKKRNKRRDAKESFLRFLKEQEENGNLSFASTWSLFHASLGSDEKADSRFASSSAMTDSDRELYFADFVLELQAAEDGKRRRIRDANRRAESAQREAYSERIQEMATQGRIVPSSRWRSVESLLQGEATYGPVYAQDPEAPREIFEDFVEEWDETYRRDRATMSKLVYSPSRATSYEEFTKALLDEAANSPELYAEIRKCISREEPVASALVYYNELIQRARDSALLSRASAQSSSEDEGEIREDVELSDEGDGKISS